jgi:multiple sugar transport system permease protein
MLPALVVLTATTIYPVIYSLVMSFFDWNWGNRFNFVGLKNYTDAFQSAEFWSVMGQTFAFAIGATTLEVILGLGLAVVVNRLRFGVNLIRTLLLTPLMVSGVIVAIMSRVMLDPLLGIMNYLLSLIGLPPSSFLGSSSTVLTTLIGIDVWWQTAFGFIILLAGLQSLPREPIEAAQVDGASAWQIFWQIKLPLLSPVLFTVIIFRTIDTLKVFDIVFGATSSGLADVMQTLTYRTAFSYQQMSRGMTYMVIFSVIIMALCFLYMRLNRSEDV